MSCFSRYFAFLQRFRLLVIFLWLVVFGFSAWLGPSLLSEVKSTFEAPKGTVFYDANLVWKKHFNTSHSTTLVLVFDDGDVRTNLTEALTMRLNASIGNLPCFSSLAGYYTTKGTPVDDFAGGLISDKFVSPDKHATLISVDYLDMDDHAQCENELVTKTKEVCLEFPMLQTGTTGTALLFRDVVDSGTSELVKDELYVVPIALGVLMAVLKSWRLMIIPLLSVLISIAVSFTVVRPFAVYHVVDIADVAPSIMMSLVIAMSIDYSLFQLTRYSREIKKGHSNTQAVRNVALHAGHIVAVSGCTLAITFLGLSLFPIDFLRSVGIGSALALCITMAINLSLVPAMLLQFSSFFQKSKTDSLRCCCCKKKPTSSGSRRNSHTQQASMDTIERVGGDDSLSRLVPLIPPSKPSFWKRSALWSTTTKHSIFIVLAVTAVSSPLLYMISDMKITIDSSQLFPSVSPAFKTFTRMTQSFDAGQISPYYVLITAPDGVVSESFFAASNAITTSMKQDPNIEATWLAVGDVSGFRFSLEDAKALLNNTDPCTHDDQSGCLGELYRTVFGSLVSLDRKAGLIAINTNFDPLADVAQAWVKKMRAILAAQNSTEAHLHGVEYYFVGTGVESIDTVNYIYKLFPQEIAITCAVVFVILGFVFRSLFVPVRVVITLAVPLANVFGLGVFVFMHTSWTGRKLPALYWLTPVMAFSILVGLGLDYDIFLFSRIHEYRYKGYSNRTAIVKGVGATGSIITAAGIIMTIAFSGLIASTQFVLREFGCFLCVAVLIDTFVARMLLVPAIMQLAGSANWWPSKPPSPFKKDDGDDSDDELEDDLGGEPNQYPGPA